MAARRVDHLPLPKSESREQAGRGRYERAGPPRPEVYAMTVFIQNIHITRLEVKGNMVGVAQTQPDRPAGQASPQSMNPVEEIRAADAQRPWPPRWFGMASIPESDLSERADGMLDAWRRGSDGKARGTSEG
jgi:hypothetical protein